MTANHRSTLAFPTALVALLCACGGSGTEPFETKAPADAPVERRLSRLAAEQIDQQSGGQVIWIDASCCAGLDPQLPESIVFGLQAVMGMHVPLFVHGGHNDAAQRLIDRLDQLGVGQRAYVVIQ